MVLDTPGLIFHFLRAWGFRTISTYKKGKRKIEYMSTSHYKEREDTQFMFTSYFYNNLSWYCKCLIVLHFFYLDLG
jgi:hypothetical protein